MKYIYIFNCCYKIYYYILKICNILFILLRFKLWRVLFVYVVWWSRKREGEGNSETGKGSFVAIGRIHILIYPSNPRLLVRVAGLIAGGAIIWWSEGSSGGGLSHRRTREDLLFIHTLSSSHRTCSSRVSTLILFSNKFWRGFNKKRILYNKDLVVVIFYLLFYIYI